MTEDNNFEEEELEIYSSADDDRNRIKELAGQGKCVVYRINDDYEYIFESEHHTAANAHFAAEKLEADVIQGPPRRQRRECELVVQQNQPDQCFDVECAQ